MKATAVLASIALVSLIGCTDNRTADKTGKSSSPAQSSAERTAQNAPSTGTSEAGLPEMNEADRTLARRVEDALRKDSSLAAAAQNVQVHATKGEVTLRGSVNNEQEKTSIGSAAQQVAGVSKVNNQIEVASASR
jgi:osmotically-inducible protein OsmY